MTWHVLECEGGYLGRTWQPSGSGGGRNPAMVILPSLAPPRLSAVLLCYGDKAVADESRRGRAMLGVDFRPVPVEFDGRGDNARIVISRGETEGGLW